jgi:hypothetical protein
VGVGDAGGVCWEDGGVVDFAGDPSLHERHVLVSRQLNWLTTAVKPCKGVVAVGWCVSKTKPPVRRRTGVTYAPADIRGQVVGLHMVLPVSSFAWTTWTKFQRLR